MIKLLMEEILRIVQRRQLLWNIQTPEERHKIHNKILARKGVLRNNNEKTQWSNLLVSILSDTVNT